MDCKLLFVYGTLLSGATGRLGAAERQRLGEEADCLGGARVCGRLYDLGSYPGLVVPGEAGEIVHGEVFELYAPQATLRWLDAYEGVSTGGGPIDEYRRVVLDIETAAGGNRMAWSYVYQRDIEAATKLSGGRWLGLHA